jgi:hypothetical protein
MAALLGLVSPGLVYSQEALTVGRSRADRWSEGPANKADGTRRQLAITSIDGKSELIVEFYPELNDLGMNVSFFDRPALPCHTDSLNAIANTSLLVDGKVLPHEHADSFTAGCAYEAWIERVVLGSVDANVAIVQAFLDAKDGVVHVSSADGKFDHTFTAKGFRTLERGDTEVYKHSKGYQLVKSTEH